MTFFEFIDQVILIIKNLGLSFWVSVIIISPLAFIRKHFLIVEKGQNM